MWLFQYKVITLIIIITGFKTGFNRMASLWTTPLLGLLGVFDISIPNKHPCLFHIGASPKPPPSHGPLHFVTSHSHFHACLCEKNKAPAEDEADQTCLLAVINIQNVVLDVDQGISVQCNPCSNLFCPKYKEHTFDN